MDSKPAVMPGAEPFAFDGGSTGVLLVHGFTGTPQGLREWGEYLAAQGYAVICPRLPGHGTQPKDLHGVTYREFVDEAQRGLDGLLSRCSSVFIAGLSMGGTIVLDLVERRGDELAGMILVNPFVYTKDPRAALTPLLGKLPILMKGVYNDIAEPGQNELGYPKLSTKAWATLWAAAKGVKANLPKIHLPTLIFASKQDHVVHPGNASLVHESIASTDKELVWLERSYHVATLDYERHQIFEQSAKFIASHEGE